MVLVLAIRLLPVSYSVFVAILLVLNLSEPRIDLHSGQNLWPLQSDLRQVLNMFPLFMAIGVWAQRWPILQNALIYVWLPLQGILILQYLQGFWII